MKKDILELFKELHEHETFVRVLNPTFLVLIAKVGRAQSIKVLSQRMANVMSKVIRDIQHAFVSDR